MKRFKLYIILIAGLFIAGCESDYVPPHEQGLDAPFVQWVTSPVFSVILGEGTPKFTGELRAPSDNVTEYNVYVGLSNTASGDVPSTYVKTMSTLPGTLEITVDEIASALGVSVDDIVPGTIANIEATTKREGDDTEFTSADLNGDMFNPAMKQAFQYSIFFVCSWVQAEAVGEYTITRDDFASSLDPEAVIQCVAGPGDNEVTFIDLFRHPEAYDVVVTLDDTDFAAASILKQPAWHCDNFGCPYGEGRIEGTGGVYFGCTGFLTIDVEHTVDLGSFGVYRLELSK